MPTWEQVEQQREAREQAAASERQRVSAAEQQRQQQKQQAIRLRDRLLAITYESLGATPAEQQRVELLMKQNKPEQYGQPEAHHVMLLTIRALTEVAQGNA